MYGVLDEHLPGPFCVKVVEKNEHLFMHCEIPKSSFGFLHKSAQVPKFMDLNQLFVVMAGHESSYLLP